MIAHVIIRVLALAAAPCVVAGTALAQGTGNYPSKPVRIIVSANIGGGADIQARMFAQKVSENMNHPFVIDNRPGAGGTIAQALAAQAAPDGYTLLTVAAAFTFAPALYPSLPFDPLKDLAPIALVSKTPFMLVINPTVSAKSVSELIALAKAKPGALNMSITNGATNHLFAAHFASLAGINVTLVPYKGGTQDIVDMMAGRIQMTMGAVLTFLPYIKSGKLRALAVTMAERSPAVPDLPTMIESGVRGYDVSSWQGWMAPARTPPAILNKLSAELAKAAKSPDLVKRQAEEGGVPVGSTPEQFRKFIAEEIPRWRKVVKESGIHVE